MSSPKRVSTTQMPSSMFVTIRNKHTFMRIDRLEDLSHQIYCRATIILDNKPWDMPIRISIITKTRRMAFEQEGILYHVGIPTTISEVLKKKRLNTLIEWAIMAILRCSARLVLGSFLYIKHEHHTCALASMNRKKRFRSHPMKFSLW